MHRDRSWLILVGILAVTYFAAARMGLALAVIHPSATPVWPPTGIALAALLLLGSRVWPGVFLGAFLANMATAGTIWTSLGIAAGNTLEAIVGAHLVRTYARGAEAFERSQDIFKFALLAAMLSTTVSATIGVTSLSLGGFARWNDFGKIWLTWWLGDAVGALVVAPLVILWNRYPGIRWTREQAVERAVFLVGLLLVAWVVFGGVFAFAYVTVPVLVWAAFRFGTRDTATVIALLGAVAVWATQAGRGPFAGATPNDALLLLQAFMGTMVIVMLPLAATVTERMRVEDERARLNDALRQERNIIAETLQRSLLPARLPEIPGLPVAAHYAPASPEAVGGDWYDVLALPGGQVGLAIGDVAGRGVGSAVTMGRLRHALRAYAVEGHPPEKVLELLGNLMEPDEMATVFYMVFDSMNWTVRYANAGHPPPLAVEPGGRGRFLEGSGLPLGARSRRAYRAERATLAPDTMLILYTDGLIEEAGVSIEEGLRRLERAAPIAANGPWDELPTRLTALTLDGRIPQDDIAVLAFRAAPLDARRLHIRQPALPSSLPEIRHTLRRWLGQAEVDSEEAFAVVVAVGEACTNVIEHAYGPSDAGLEVEGTCVDGHVSIAVSDRGAWRAPHPRGQGGRGIQLMRQLMDNVEIQAGSDGTTVRLSRRVRPKVNV